MAIKEGSPKDGTLKDEALKDGALKEGGVTHGPLKAASLAALLAVSSPALPADAALPASDPGDEVPALEARAAHGDAEAAFRLGMLAELGRGTKRDEAAAFRWYRQAAQAGLPDAAFNVAAMFAAGNGTPQDARQAARWYAGAAMRGVSRAAYDLGQMYAAGQGVPTNPSLAARWLAASHLPAARDLLAEIQDHPPPPASPDAALLPPVPQAPLPGPHPVLVWAAPAEPMPVRYFVCIARLAPDGPRETANLVTDRSAVPIALPDPHADYAWRVFAIAPGRYAASPWQRL